jgi:hypothetical protein
MFLKNLFRYPKFLLSSVIGLITIIISTFIINLKKFKTKSLFTIITSLIFVLIFITFLLILNLI